VTCASAAEGTLLVGTTGGIFRSDDLAQSWRAASQGLAEDHLRWLAFHPEVAGLALAGTEPADIFVTRDNGETWNECREVTNLRDENGWYLPYSPQAGCVRGFAFHGSRAYAAVEQGGLLRSDDYGQTWREAGGSTGDPRAEIPDSFIQQDVHSVAVHGSSPDLVVAPTGGGLYRSDDGGDTWNLLYKCYCRAVWLDPETPDHLIFGPADGVSRNGRMEESRDGGRTWQPASVGLSVPWPNHMVERFVALDSELYAVLSNGHVLAARLSALEWQRVFPDVADATAATVLRL
jgi:photosystem II stability/assembly factor-like uncharacterized protein